MRDIWPTHDWTIAAPEEHGFDPTRLEALRTHIPRVLPQIRSVLVARHGRLVFEEYFHGLGPGDDHEIASVTKSITSAVIGLALADGAFSSIDQRVSDFFSDDIRRLNASGFEGITLRHLLTLTTGLRWDERRFREWLAAPNQIEFALSLPRRSAPGTEFRYNTPAMHLLSPLVHRATGSPFADYAQQRLFNPLGISQVRWARDHQDHALAGLGLALRARDLARIGLLFASDGNWENRPLISKDWIQLSTSPHSEGGPPEDERYGFLWWIDSSLAQRAFFAGGFGGQFIYVLPDADIVVVITSSLHAPHRENRSIVPEFILPALQD